ncbi:MAG: hypothetical protein DRP08_06765 [Candidatus Aenigmatarchaeota archaeon]|nr:MAG: hypothetical protein DRP08_06765 [Candidatus Aenigmarchaeota archaeon]
MNPQTKFAAAIGAGFIVFILLMSMGASLMDDVNDQPADSTSVEDSLWVERNFDMIILAVMMFAAVLGVLALVGGEFKWQ